MNSKFILSATKRNQNLSKNDRRYNSRDGFQIAEIQTFEKCVNLFNQNLAFSMQPFEDGVRKAEHKVYKLNYIVLDIDTSDQTIFEVHDELSDYNHIISTTSNRENQFKFRIFLPLEKEIEFHSTRFREILGLIGDRLDLIVDKLAFSQVIFSYKNSIVLVNEYGGNYNLELRELAKQALWKEVEQQPNNNKEFCKREAFATFRYSYAKTIHGNHNGIYRLLSHSHRLGNSRAYTESLLADVLDYTDYEIRSGYAENIIGKLYKQNR